MYSGVLSVGVGDAMAATAGSLFGRLKWPGTTIITVCRLGLYQRRRGAAQAISLCNNVGRGRILVAQRHCRA